MRISLFGVPKNAKKSQSPKDQLENAHHKTLTAKRPPQNDNRQLILGPNCNTTCSTTGPRCLEKIALLRQSAAPQEAILCVTPTSAVYFLKFIVVDRVTVLRDAQFGERMQFSSKELLSLFGMPKNIKMPIAKGANGKF